MNEDDASILPWIPSGQSRNHKSAPSWRNTRYKPIIMLRVEKPLASHKYENWEHLRLPKCKESFPVTARGAPQIEQLICNSRKRFALLFAVSRTVASTRYFCNPAFAQRCNALRSFAARFWPTKMDSKKTFAGFIRRYPTKKSGSACLDEMRGLQKYN